MSFLNLGDLKNISSSITSSSISSNMSSAIFFVTGLLIKVKSISSIVTELLGLLIDNIFPLYIIFNPII